MSGTRPGSGRAALAAVAAFLAAICASAAPLGTNVAVVCATEATAPGEAAFAKAMADRAEALLRKAGIADDRIGDDFSPASLRPYQTVLLPYSPSLSAAAVTNLTLFLERGGRLLVFSNASRELAKAMGIGVGERCKGDYPMTAMELAKPFGACRRFPYYGASWIPPAVPRRSKARTIAWFVGANGARTSVPAVVLSARGAWFGQVPPRAYPAAADTIAAIIAGDASLATRRQKPLAALQRDKTVAAWVTSPYPRFRRGWRAAARTYHRGGINTVFLRVQTGDTLLEAANAGGTDHVAAAIRACHANGISIHAWVCCFSLDGMPAERRKALADAGRIIGGGEGWIDPRNPSNRAEIAASLARLSKRGFDGIHLDFVRTPDFGFPREPGYFQTITAFVREASAAVRAATPSAVLSAAVYATPAAASRRNQDWPQWVSEGLVDFVAPMTYTESPTAFKTMLDECLAKADGSKLLPGIGTGSNDSQAGTEAVDEEIRLCGGCRGVAFFALEDALLELLGK